jgi:hypothetical protein
MHPFENGLNYQTMRINYALELHKQFLQRMEAWLNQSREASNFTYDLEPNNLNHLAAFVCGVTALPLAQAEGYIGELLSSELLRDVVRDVITEGGMVHKSDPEARVGRRAGWYALARASRPKVVVETGVDKGLGSCVLAEALRRNAEEGHAGRLYAVDINPDAGILLKASEYAQYGEFVASDAIEFLQAFHGKIDLLVSDSEHSPEYEERELEAARPRMAPQSVIVSDNAHVTDNLYRYARRYGKRFLFFQERPAHHIYAGGGIGACY